MRWNDDTFEQIYYERNEYLSGPKFSYRTRPVPHLQKMTLKVVDTLPPGVSPSRLEVANTRRSATRTPVRRQPVTPPLVEGLPSSGLNTRELGLADLQGVFTGSCINRFNYEYLFEGNQMKVLQRYFGDKDCQQLKMTIEYQVRVESLGYAWPAEKVLLL